MGLGVPQPAGIRADLVSQDDGAVGKSAELQLEVHQGHAAAEPEGLQQFVDFQSVGADGLNLLGGSQLQSQGMAGIQQGIAQSVIFIREFESGLIEHNALFHAVVLGKGAGGNVADNDLQGHDLHLLDQGLPVAEFLDIVGGDAVLFQHRHEPVAHFVVDDTLADDGALFQSVERGGIILVCHDQKLGVIGGKHLLGFSFVQLLFRFHVCFLLFIFRCHRSWTEPGRRDL